MAVSVRLETIDLTSTPMAKLTLRLVKGMSTVMRGFDPGQGWKPWLPTGFFTRATTLMVDDDNLCNVYKETSERNMIDAANAPKIENGKLPLYFFSTPA